MRIIYIGLLSTLLASACNAGNPSSPDQSVSSSNPSPSRVSSSGAPIHPARPAQSDGSSRSAAQHPAPGDVLDAIYHQASHGASAYRIADGGWATYWYSYAFDLNGRHYYTGFAYDVPRGSDGPNDMPSPDTKVAIAQATFERVDPEGAGPWSLVGAARRIGLFGGSGKGYAIDDARQPRSTPTSTGKLLLAAPTWYLASGTRVGSYELFLFDPNAQGARWRYLGNVEAGEDNGAACDEKDGGRIACVKSIGALAFVPQNGSDMPLVRLAMSGTAIDDSGKVRTLGPADAVAYRYNPARQSYVTSRP